MRDINARAYTGTMNSGDREQLEDALIANQCKALVATTALDMGYDKPDLGFVIHYQVAGSVVAYCQQVGRAGRALPSAYGVLLGGEEERSITAWFIRYLHEPHSIDELALLLDVSKTELRRWCLRLMKQGRVRKLSKPVRYVCQRPPG